MSVHSISSPLQGRASHGILREVSSAISLIVIAFNLVMQLPLPAASAKQLETIPNVIAAQLRRQGMMCTMPRNAVRDQKTSTPHVAVWTLQCDEANYRVRLIPRKGAHVNPVVGDSAP